MAGIGLTPCRSMIAENIRDLQRRARHLRRALSGRPRLTELAGDMLQRAHHFADGLGRNSGVKRRAVQFGVTKQDLDPLSVEELHARIAILEAEIVRVRTKLENAVNFRSTADELFRK